MSSGQYIPPSVSMNLPPGWECKLDPTTRRYFYIDHVNKKTQWTAPTIPGYGTSPSVAVMNRPAAIAATLSSYGGTSSRQTTGVQSQQQQRYHLNTSAAAATSPTDYSLGGFSSASSDNSSVHGDYSSSTSKGRGGKATSVAPNQQLRRRLQLMFNANTAAEQEIISDVLIACNNNEKQAVTALSGLSMFKARGGTATLSKPQSTHDSSSVYKQEQNPTPLTEKEKAEVVSRLHIGYGGYFTKASLEEIASKHGYDMNATKKELNKLKDSASKSNNSSSAAKSSESVGMTSIINTMRDYSMGESSGLSVWSTSLLTDNRTSSLSPPNINIPKSLGSGGNTAQVGKTTTRVQPKFTPAAKENVAPRKAFQSNADLRSDGKRKEQLGITAFGSGIGGMRARSNSEYIGSSRARGPDSSLLSNMRISVVGPRRGASVGGLGDREGSSFMSQSAVGRCSGLARGPTCVVQGSNASLLCK